MDGLLEVEHVFMYLSENEFYKLWLTKSCKLLAKY